MAAEPMTPQQAEVMAAKILGEALSPVRWWCCAVLSAPLVVPAAMLAGIWHGVASGFWLAGSMAEAVVNHLALHVYLRQKQAAHAWRTWWGLRR